MDKIPYKKPFWLYFCTCLFLLAISRTGYADNAETYAFSFDWYGVRLVFVAFGILLGGVLIRRTRGFFGAIGGALIGLFSAAWFGTSSPGEFRHFVITGCIPTVVFATVVGILAQIYKTYDRTDI